MNDMAALPTHDPSAWDELIRQAKDDGSYTVTQAAVMEVLDVDVEHLDREIATIRALLDEHGVRLDEEAEVLTAAELEAQSAEEAAAHVAEVLADPLGGIQLAADDEDGPRRARLKLVKTPRAMADRPEVKLHSYGKESRPGRKVGHVTATGDELDDAVARARAAAAFFQG